MAAQFPACSDSSSRSGASSRRRRQPGKPIPYRQLPFDYEPAVLCECGEKMPQWISWSDPNHGIRYLNCKIRSIDGDKGCNRFKWVDDPLDKYHKELVRDLRDAVWDRDEEIERLQEEILLLAGRKQSNHEPKNQADGSNLFMVWVLSVAFAIYCTWVMCSN